MSLPRIRKNGNKAHLGPTSLPATSLILTNSLLDLAFVGLAQMIPKQ